MAVQTVKTRSRDIPPGYVSLADACALAGVQPRTLQHWTLKEVVRCEPSTLQPGTGSYRTYEAREVALAALVARVAETELPTTELRAIAERVREIYANGGVRSVKAAEDQMETCNDVEAGRSTVLFYKALHQGQEDGSDIAAVVRKADGSEWGVVFVRMEDVLRVAGFLTSGKAPRAAAAMFVVNATNAFKGIGEV